MRSPHRSRIALEGAFALVLTGALYQLGGLGPAASMASSRVPRAVAATTFISQRRHNPTPAQRAAGAPKRPPADICGNLQDLNGPTVGPEGSVVLNPSENVPDLVAFT